MSWFLAALGFSVLIVLHELGHFAVAKWVGMRVERFSLFFPPLLARKKRGETEYAIGSIPLGGYVKITGMNPHEELDPAVAHRAYFRQAVWKRIAVIVAGPVVNIVLAFVILFGLFLDTGKVRQDARRVAEVEVGLPAAGLLRPGDVITAVDGRALARPEDLSKRIAAHKCAGPPRKGCRAESPVVLKVDRGGRELTLSVRPVYDPRAKQTRVGFLSETIHLPVGTIEAAGLAVSDMWAVTSGTVSTIAQLFKAEKREELSGVVGSYEYTRRAVDLSFKQALTILALISLSLGVINLFPFLPLDGGHIFWALAEKVRGKRISFSVMERAGFVGFALVLFLFVIGLSNDIERIANGGFEAQR